MSKASTQQRQQERAQREYERVYKPAKPKANFNHDTQANKGKNAKRRGRKGKSLPG